MSVEKLFFKGKEIVLVGTAHISKQSVELVQETIEKEKPETVGVELDSQRFYQLKSGQKWAEMDIARVVKEGKTYLFLVNILLSNMQMKLGKGLGLKPGMEMLEAIKLSEAKGLRVALLDRDVRVTLKRAMDSMRLIEKLRLGFEIILSLFQKHEPITEEVIEGLKDQDTLNALLEELSVKMPSIKRVLVDERDLFIANRIANMPGKKVLAVVGAGHIEGIKRLIGTEANMRELLSINPKKNKLRILKYAIPAAVVAILAYGFYTKGIYATAQLFMFWFLINGVLSALGAALAKAHPFSIATAFLAAPFTSLHPALAAGWFAAAMEAKIRCPKVKDFQGLRNLDSYSDFSKNRVTRVLLVAAYSNLGSTIGTIVALPYILSMLG